ncbi:hypothetical protein AG0111_0g10130 [Alternaria gaisen]|uniref:Uncharacterized protein n=1 Tax=Alternaria gaisen TaxID=167740 RepID=A0ACB6FAX7_9PLEO|nr:hypothetical protein AG0111_0g10130 [Alternaria gaisen]
MDPQRNINVNYDEPPPPYEYPQDQELPGSSIHELPDRHIPTQELEEFHGLTELEGSPTQASQDPFDLKSSQASYPASNANNERGMSTSPLVIQSFNPGEDQMLLWSLNTQQPFATAPSMTRDGQSHTSSPISPSTPDVDSIYPIQIHSNRHFAAGTVSPLENVSPYRDYWSKSHLVDVDCNYALCISLPTSLEASPVHPFREGEQQFQRGTFHMQQDGCFSVLSPSLTNNEHYTSNNDPVPAWDGVLAQPYGQSHSTARIPLGDYTYSDNLGWRYCGGYGQEETANEEAKHTVLAVSKPESSQLASNSMESQQPSRKYIELYDHQDPELQIASRPDDIDYPLVPCNRCDKTFSGRYAKGNLRRHVLAFHNPLAKVLGTACRVCKKVYKRADATRKHEWKKHHIPDAKPKKRAK